MEKMINFIKRQFNVYLPSIINTQIRSNASYPITYLIPVLRERQEKTNILLNELYKAWLTLSLASRVRGRNVVDLRKINQAVVAYKCKDGVCGIWYNFNCGNRADIVITLNALSCSELQKGKVKATININKSASFEEINLAVSITQSQGVISNVYPGGRGLTILFSRLRDLLTVHR